MALNRKLNKVTYGSEELLNLENDTVNEENLLRGETAHNSLGEGIVGEMDEGGGTSNYNHLSNKPKINGTTLEGNKTGGQLGLVSASDLANYYTKSSVDTLLAGKSTVTPTLQAGTKIGEVQTGGSTVNLYAPAGGATTVDSELSLESVNPVQNKVITAALSDKADEDDLDALEREIDAIAANYSNVTATLTSGTKIGEIHTNGTTTNLFAPSGGGGGGTSNYEELSNKPQINSVSLEGNKTAAQLGLATASDVSGKQDKTLDTPLTIGGAVKTSVEGALGALNARTNADTLTTARAIDGVNFDGSAAISHYGTSGTSGSTQTKTVSITGFTLVQGARVFVKFDNTNTHATSKLNVTSTGGKEIKYKGAAPPPYFIESGRVYEFVYDGTYWQMVGDGDGSVWTSAASCLVGDTSKTISHTAIKTTSVIKAYSETTSGVPVSYEKIVVSAGQAVITFSAALTEAASIKLQIIN